MMKYCKDCIYSKPKQNMNVSYCGKHRKYITEYTVSEEYKNRQFTECKDYEKNENRSDRR